MSSPVANRLEIFWKDVTDIPKAVFETYGKAALIAAAVAAVAGVCFTQMSLGLGMIVGATMGLALSVGHWVVLNALKRMDVSDNTRHFVGGAFGGILAMSALRILFTAVASHFGILFATERFFSQRYVLVPLLSGLIGAGTIVDSNSRAFAFS